MQDQCLSAASGDCWTALQLVLNSLLLCMHRLQEQKTRLMQQDEERTAKRRAKRQKQKVLCALLLSVALRYSSC